MASRNARSTSYSVMKPYPPWTWTAASAALTNDSLTNSFVIDASIAALRAFDEPLPETQTDPAATLRLLDEVGSPASMAMAGPRFFGFVIGGSLPVALGILPSLAA